MRSGKWVCLACVPAACAFAAGCVGGDSSPESDDDLSAGAGSDDDSANDDDIDDELMGAEIRRLSR
ncbi:MAG: hypothetical protein IT350_13755 [Deltaproteobacteria bacterium]|nr:hypothetical protein [Deltaproteobacteria bacterium]